MLELQSGDRMLKDVLWRSPPGAERVESARAQLRELFERVLERAHAHGGLRPDFGFADLAVLRWSFGPLVDAAAELGSTVWARQLHLLLDGLRSTAATPQSEPPLSEDAMRLLRERRLGRRADGPEAQPSPRLRASVDSGSARHASALGANRPQALADIAQPSDPAVAQADLDPFVVDPADDQRCGHPARAADLPQP